MLPVSTHVKQVASLVRDLGADNKKKVFLLTVKFKLQIENTPERNHFMFLRLHEAVLRLKNKLKIKENRKLVFVVQHHSIGIVQLYFINILVVTPVPLATKAGRTSELLTEMGNRTHCQRSNPLFLDLCT